MLAALTCNQSLQDRGGAHEFARSDKLGRLSTQLGGAEYFVIERAQVG
jgi:hypothetical protein